MMKGLIKAGHIITSDWTAHRTSHNLTSLAREASEDFNGVMEAEVHVITPPCRLGTSTEMGIALARHIPIFIVGMSYMDKTTNVFFNSQQVKHVQNMDELLYLLDMLEGKDKK